MGSTQFTIDTDAAQQVAATISSAAATLTLPPDDVGAADDGFLTTAAAAGATEAARARITGCGSELVQLADHIRCATAQFAAVEAANTARLGEL